MLDIRAGIWYHAYMDNTLLMRLGSLHILSIEIKIEPAGCRTFFRQPRKHIDYFL